MPLVNGRENDNLSIHDRGLHYGDGLFETIAIRNGKLPVLWDRHMARLRLGCQRLGILPVDDELLRQEATRCIQAVTDGVLKIIVTRGVSGRGYRTPSVGDVTRILTTYPASTYPASYRDDGIVMRVCRMRLGCNETLAGIKHLNRLEQVLARAEWTDPEIIEGVMLDSDENVIEGTMTNLFFVAAGGLKTPDLSQCGVAGVLRECIINIAADNSIRCEIGRYTLQELEQADEIFVCNSIVGVWPVRQLGHRSYRKGPVTERIARWLVL
ncbi:MAG: 4-amino-4-deoxychorismate lyase [Gammaproteobacteria bacterium]|nr:MAG: 4-amino-4-deoxychorismate lyase [Gammaproteobacteria bacterium]TND06863.1 MAG: 4-amino-4-deoxychorismate lyase [Gammaproteobacteria bacterium]